MLWQQVDLAYEFRHMNDVEVSMENDQKLHCESQAVNSPGAHTGVEGMLGRMVVQSWINAFLCATQQGVLLMGLPVGELMLGA